MTGPLAVGLTAYLGPTGLGGLWRADSPLGPVTVEVVDFAAAERAGLDPALLDVLPTLLHPALATPLGVANTPYGPGLVLAPVIGRPLVLSGPVGDLDSMVAAATHLLEGLAVLHDAGLTHRAITPSLLCPGPDGAPQLAVTAAAAVPGGDRLADVDALLAALRSVDPSAAAELSVLLQPAGRSGLSPARDALEQLQRRDTSAGATVLHPTPEASLAAPVAPAAEQPLPAAWLPGSTAELGQPAPSPRTHTVQHGRSPGAAGPVRRYIAEHTLLLGIGGAAVALLAAANITVAASGHHRHTAAPAVAVTSARPSPTVALDSQTNPTPPAPGGAVHTTPVPVVVPTTVTPAATPIVTPAVAAPLGSPPPSPTHRPTVTKKPRPAATANSAMPSVAPAPVIRTVPPTPAPARPTPVEVSTVKVPAPEASPTNINTATVAPPH